MHEVKIDRIVVHPLVLLSVVDHFNRIIKISNQKRVVGVLLGSIRKNILDISNSFAVPFEEDEKDSNVWLFDHEYLESMYGMFKKVNAKEKIVGWYHTGPKLYPNDILINELMRKFSNVTVLVIIDVKPKEIGLPTEAYTMVEEIHEDGTPTSKTFQHIPSEIGAEEAEEVGVEHLLRDIKESNAGTLSQRITYQFLGLKGLEEKLKTVCFYLQQVIQGKMAPNHQVLYILQDILNLLPDITVPDFIKSNLTKTNDELLIIYVSAMIRSILSLNNLINNQITNRDEEKKEFKKDENDSPKNAIEDVKKAKGSAKETNTTSKNI